MAYYENSTLKNLIGAYTLKNIKNYCNCDPHTGINYI